MQEALGLFSFHQSSALFTIYGRKMAREGASLASFELRNRIFLDAVGEIACRT